MRTGVRIDEKGAIIVSCECEKLRPLIYEMAQQMELIMGTHDDEKGDSYKTCDLEYLEKKFDEEINEYRNEKRHGVKVREAVDIAIVATMLRYRHFQIVLKQAEERMEKGEDGEEK